MSYSTGIIYKIICTQVSDIVYIGSTFNSLRNRWQEHKYDYKKYLDGKDRNVVSIYPYFQKYGIENFKIIRIKGYECYRENRSDRKHLNVYEQLWINKTKSCVNKTNPFWIKKLYHKLYNVEHKEQSAEYYEKNKDKIKLYSTEYYKNNKEKRVEYYEKNKDKLKLYRSEYYKNNKEKRVEYYENNKDKRKLKRAEYYENNKEQIRDRQKQTKFCIFCKRDITKNYFKKHTRTKTHIQNAKKVIYNFIISKYI